MLPDPEGPKSSSITLPIGAFALCCSDRSHCQRWLSRLLVHDVQHVAQFLHGIADRLLRRYRFRDRQESPGGVATALEMAFTYSTVELYSTKMKALCESPDRAARLLLVLTPIAMSLINDSWLYTEIAWLDPWYNIAYFLHYSDPNFLNWYYKIARLPWIIPGYLAYSVFTPVVANYILHMGALILSALALYSGLRRLFGVDVAFLTAALLTVYVPFHGSGGWDYQTTPSGAYYLLTFAILTHAALAREKRSWLLFLSGVTYGATVHANVIFINMAPILALHFLTTLIARRSEKPSWREIVRYVLLAALGILAVTVVLGLINLAVGRDFIFFKVLFNFVVSYVADTSHEKSWWIPWSDLWFVTPKAFSYLAIPFCIGLLGLGVLAVAASMRFRFDAVALSLVAQYVFVALMWVFWQSVGHTALTPSYFAYPLIPPMFCAIGGMAALLAKRPCGSRGRYGIYAIVVVAVAGPLALGAFADTLAPRPVLNFILILGPTLAAMLILIFVRNRLIWMAGAAITFGIGNYVGAVATRANLVLPDLALQPGYAYSDVCRDRRQYFEALITADRFLSTYAQSRVDGYTNVYVWWDAGERLKVKPACSQLVANFASSMTSFGSNYLAPPWDGMPAAAALPDSALRSLPDDVHIAVPTANSSTIEALIQRFHTAGIDLNVDGKLRLNMPPLYLYVLSRSRCRGDL
jgi:hypothetical protein